VTNLCTAASTTINAPIQEVWRALTTPDPIRQWFYGVDTETDWKVGSPPVHRGAYLGKPYQDKGEITQFDPPIILAHQRSLPCFEPDVELSLSGPHGGRHGLRRECPAQPACGRSSADSGGAGTPGRTGYALGPRLNSRRPMT
jgi:Activator of Hsp90 ATPase homolog 1-like protein